MIFSKPKPKANIENIVYHSKEFINHSKQKYFSK